MRSAKCARVGSGVQGVRRTGIFGGDVKVEIESVKIVDVSIPFSRPLGSAVNTAERRHGCVVILSGGGHLGFGEAPVLVLPSYDEQFVRQTHVAIAVFFAEIFAGAKAYPLGADQVNIEDAIVVLGRFRGNSAAKAAIEMGLLDLYARQASISASEVIAQYARALGHIGIAGRFGEIDQSAPIQAQGTSLGIDEGQSTRLAQTHRLAALGYRRIKVKVDSDVNLEEMRELCASSPVEMSADANGTISDRDFAMALADAGFSYLEQPFAAGSMRDLARLHDLGATRIALDESISSPGALKDAVAYVPFSLAVFKISRLGGVAGLLEAVAIAEAAKLDFYIGGMYDTPILRRLNAVMIKALAPAAVSDLGPESDYFDASVPPSLYRQADGSLMLVGDDGLTGAYVPPEDCTSAIEIIVP